MTPFIKEKLTQLQSLIDDLSERQRKIRSVSGVDYNDELDIEDTGNGAIIRIASEMKKVLRGVPFQKRYRVDPSYIRWITKPAGYYICSFAGERLGLEDEIYRSPSSCWVWKNKEWYYRYFDPKSIFNILVNWLFPKPVSQSIFRFQIDEDIECDVWRSTFEGLIRNDWEKLKELECV